MTTNKNHVAQLLANPLYSQAQALLKVGKQELSTENILGTIEAIHQQAQKTKDGDFYYLETCLHGQISLLSAMATEFGNKAIAAYSSPEILTNFPQLPGEFMSIAMRCQSEMRKCINLLYQIKNPKKSATFIKNYVNQQLNQLEVKQQLEKSYGQKLDTTRTGEATTSYQTVETLETQHRTEDRNGKSDRIPK